MGKITFMGAGSTVFARNVLGDCMCTPSLCDAEIALYDIDPVRLDESYRILSTLNKNINEGRAVIETYLGVENRKEALRGATFVVNAIQVGGYEPCTVTDFEIPKKYGLQQTIADTLGLYLLQWAKYDKDVAGIGFIEANGTSKKIMFVCTVIPAFVYTGVWLLMRFGYPLTKEKLEPIYAFIREKRESAQQSA